MCVFKLEITTRLLVFVTYQLFMVFVFEILKYLVVI